MAAFALLLAGCGGEGEASPSASAAPTPSSISAEDAKSKSIEDIAVKGKADKEPKVSFEAPLVVEKDGSKVLDEGDGKKVKAGQQVTANMTLVSGNDGNALESSYKSGEPAGFPVDKEQIAETLYDAVVDKKLGSRILLVLNGAAKEGEAEQTLVYVIDLVSAKDVPKPLDRAEGEKVDPKKGLPTVELAKDGKPTITVPKADPPKDLTVQPLIKGKGEKVSAGQTVTVHYTGVLWDGGEQFDSSWDKGQPYPVPNIGQAQVIDGWNEALVGQTVGSQLLLVVPADKGYGNEPKGSIPADSTLVFVVDILQAS
ncbi:FKBP-type peptidyl-prolyl cis-trans isomerase [Saxibacter everestensis]|uniref:Peptidyl-prolyl cis-trans isomerase n=1 Tax=Saxibacter everestensis TaxID=2909229 RepID=A0ABY8QXD7_9MICO|nr:FKBP-type peptidyl-prolyl cis-trans isomerase [Brevibacteriaceae bacterium ZFBP1038]